MRTEPLRALSSSLEAVRAKSQRRSASPTNCTKPSSSTASCSSPGAPDLSRLIFFLLLIAAIAFGSHLWLTAKTEKTDYSSREKNRDEMRIVAVTSPAVAAQNVEDARRTVQSLAGSACVEFSGIAAEDATRARDAFNTLPLGKSLSERRGEEITPYWDLLTPARHRAPPD